MFYLGVFGDDDCEYTINTLLKRKGPDNKTTGGVMDLIEGISQQFIMDLQETELKFFALTRSKNNFTLELIEISGHITYSIKD